MFGYWKRRCREAVEAGHEMADERDRWKALAVDRLRLLGKAADERLASERELRARASAADLQLAAERRDNERLAARLKTARAGLDHATHCYEQCEADRKALADERDGLARRVQLCDLGVVASQQERDDAIKDRDEWREAAEDASATGARVLAICRRFMTDLSLLKEPANAGDPDPDHAPRRAHGAGPRCIVRPGVDCECRRGPRVRPDADPDFIRFPGRDAEAEGEGPGAA